MTRRFEVTKRDGAARLGTLRWNERELTTPRVLESKEDLALLKKAAGTHGELHVAVVSDTDTIGSQEITADVVILGAALRFEQDPRGLSKAIVEVRESINPDAALYAPALATPANLSLLIYAGVDLVDSVLAEVKAREGIVLHADGEDRLDERQDVQCLCGACLGAADDATTQQNVARTSEHNRVALLTELGRARQHVEQGTLRELVEGRCRAAPVMTAFLRLLDERDLYFERRAPIVRSATLLACSLESLNRPEILRFSERVTSRLTQREGVLLLLPCSARKPYSHSRSHKIILERVHATRPFINEAIITSPIGVVPRSLEVMYPASNYDVPVTGKWTCDEREWVKDRLVKFMEVNSFSAVVAHVDGPYREICDDVAAELGINVVYSVEDGGVLNPAALQRLEAILNDAVEAYSPNRRDIRFDYIRDSIDYQFGKGASTRIFPSAPRVRGRFPTYYVSERNRRIATFVEKYGTCALTIEGAKRYIGNHASHYCVWIDDFVPKGTVFAVGVQRADPQIRPFDEVIVLNENTIAVGRAFMSGWEMQASTRGAAVAVRHVEDR